jgi:hypothetical protein
MKQSRVKWEERQTALSSAKSAAVEGTGTSSDKQVFSETLTLDTTLVTESMGVSPFSDHRPPSAPALQSRPRPNPHGARRSFTQPTHPVLHLPPSRPRPHTLTPKGSNEEAVAFDKSKSCVSGQSKAQVCRVHMNAMLFGLMDNPFPSRPGPAFSSSLFSLCSQRPTDARPPQPNWDTPVPSRAGPSFFSFCVSL